MPVCKHVHGDKSSSKYVCMSGVWVVCDLGFKLCKLSLVVKTVQLSIIVHLATLKALLVCYGVMTWTLFKFECCIDLHAHIDPIWISNRQTIERSELAIQDKLTEPIWITRMMW